MKTYVLQTIWLPDCSKLVINHIMTITSQFANMTSSSNVFDVALFRLRSLATGPSFMTISLLVLELWQFCFIRDWPEIRKLETPQPELCPISGDCSKLEIPNFARKSLMKCYSMQKNAFYHFWVIKGKTTGGTGRGVKLTLSPRLYPGTIYWVITHCIFVVIGVEGALIKRDFILWVWLVTFLMFFGYVFCLFIYLSLFIGLFSWVSEFNFACFGHFQNTKTWLYDQQNLSPVCYTGCSIESGRTYFREWYSLRGREGGICSWFLFNSCASLKRSLQRNLQKNGCIYWSLD